MARFLKLDIANFGNRAVGISDHRSGRERSDGARDTTIVLLIKLGIFLSDRKEVTLFVVKEPNPYATRHLYAHGLDLGAGI